MASLDNHAIADVVADVRGIADDRDRVSIGAVIETLGAASHSGLILIPALIAATPLSGIPGLTSVCGITIALLAVQMLWSQERLWLPDWILQRQVESDDLRSALDKAQPVIGFLDRHSHQRLRIFVRAPGRLAIRLVIVACGLVMPFLEIIPFTGSLMAGVVVFLSIALLTRDGLFALIGVGFLAATLGTAMWLI